jgi:hypothetical protein
MPPLRMPKKMIDRKTMAARAAGVSMVAVGGVTPGISEDQLAIRMNRNSVPTKAR